jgi:hypothetical protein
MVSTGRKSTELERYPEAGGFTALARGFVMGGQTAWLDR